MPSQSLFGNREVIHAFENRWFAEPEHRRYMSLKKRILSSVILFVVLLIIFRQDIFITKCPAISCVTPTNCIGGCYSYINAIPLIIIVFAGLVVPAIAYRIYCEASK